MGRDREPRSPGALSLTKEQRRHSRGKIVFAAEGAGTAGWPRAKQNKQRKNLDADVAPFAKINSKRITDVKCKLMTLPEDVAGGIWMGLALAMAF